VLERQRAYTDEIERTSGAIIPWVFHRKGRPVLCIRGAWQRARLAAGRPGALLHDFRRTAARNLLRAGVPQRLAMALCGWETDSIFRRYAVADSEMLREAGAKLAGFLNGRHELTTNADDRSS
jgi:integrase